MSTDLILTRRFEQKAFEFANFFHMAALQKRKAPPGQTPELYIVHPAEVASIVRTVPGHTIEMLCAAWMHDTLEDTHATYADILADFGSNIADMVKMLTDEMPGEGRPNRAERKALNMLRLSDAGSQVKTVKLADLISNTRNINDFDPGFVPQYMKEKRLMLPCLVGGYKPLWDVANEQVERFFMFGNHL